jgi:type I site-specific restriction-modification system R (restriction) subunit
MPKQSEQILEEKLIVQLQKMGYQYVSIFSENDLLLNLKNQLEKHNQISLSDAEFDKVLNLLNKGSVFEKSKTLRQKQHIIRDNGDNLYFEFLNIEHWCQNQYQVTNQVRYSTKTSEDFYNYYNDISKKLKDRERQPENVNNRIDVLLVVNMFLTGFDAKKVNTLYVDKNLKYHGLIQAFSRTNRILNE